jgi:predicted transcriptional regulator
MASKKNNARPQRTATQRERDKRIISELYLRGELQADIAKVVGISQATVSLDLASLRGEWLASSLMDFNDRRAQELAKVDDLEREYWTAWKRSQQDAEVKTQKMIDRPEGQSKEAQKRTEGQTGDPRFLVGIQWCVNKRCELLGLDAPKKAEITGKDGEPLYSVSADDLAKARTKAQEHEDSLLNNAG